MRYKNMLKITFLLHKCSLDILKCVSAVATKLSSLRCGNKLLKASCHLKDKSKNKKLSKSQKSKLSIAWKRQKSLKKWRSLIKLRREQQKIGPCGFLYLYDRR